MTVEKAQLLKDIQARRHDALIRIVKILDSVEEDESKLEHGDGEAARAWLLEQLMDEE